MTQLNVDFNATQKPAPGALIEAAKLSDMNAVKDLLQRDADVNEKGNLDQTALMWAAYNGDEEILRLLIDNRAALDDRDKHGHTALMWAVYQGRKETARLLIDKGATLEGVNHKGKTVHDIARSECPEIAEMLQEAAEYRSPAAVAIRKGRACHVTAAENQQQLKEMAKKRPLKLM